MASIFPRGAWSTPAALSLAHVRRVSIPLICATAWTVSTALAADESSTPRPIPATQTAKPNTAPLTFEAALQLAVTQSRLLEASAIQAGAAREMAVAAAQLPDPVLRLGINNLPIDGADRLSLSRDFMTMRSIGMSQEFTREDKRRARSGRFEREAETADANRMLTLTNVQRNTATAWLDRYHQERVLTLLERQRDEATLQIDAAAATYRGGRGLQSDVFAARSAVAQLEDRIAQAERQVAAAKTVLARWIGEAAGQPLGDRPSTDAVGLNETNLETQLLHHPQIAVMVKQEAMAQADAQVAQANKRADWSVELMLSQRGPAYSNMVSLNVSVPLQWDQKNRQDRELAAKLASVAQIRAEREDAVRAHVAEARAMLQEWHSNHARIKRYDHSILPLTTERTRAALAAYRGGASTGGTLGAVLEARRIEIETRIERLRLEIETARLWAQLNYLTPVAMDAAVPHQTGAK
jgi:outer membrane protein TolC